MKEAAAAFLCPRVLCRAEESIGVTQEMQPASVGVSEQLARHDTGLVWRVPARTPKVSEKLFGEGGEEKGRSIVRQSSVRGTLCKWGGGKG